MTLNAIELKEHCLQILEDPSINNKIVVLCEGKIRDDQGIRSPQVYKKMDQMPDANFYLACVPKWWRKPRPNFINCGNINNVIDTYLNLLELQEQSKKSYLNKEKLFAIVDLDIQLQKIDNYHYPDTEQIFYNLYNAAQVIEEQATKHRIWVTGLIHKEAYFIAPETQKLLDNSSLYPQFENQTVNLQDVYLAMAQTIIDDMDFKKHFERVIKRIDYCNNIDCSDIDKLQETWNIEFKKRSDHKRFKELVSALLTIRKAKNYWRKIEPSGNWTSSHKLFREQLSLEIGRFYAEQDCNCKNHIPYFFKTLYQFA